MAINLPKDVETGATTVAGTLVVVDDAMGSKVSHMGPFIRGICDTANMRSMNSVVYAHKKCPLNAIPEATVYPIFEPSFLERFEASRGTRKWTGWLKHNASFYETMRPRLLDLKGNIYILATHSNIFSMVALRFIAEVPKIRKVVLSVQNPVWSFYHNSNGKVLYRKQAPLVKMGYRLFGSLVKSGKVEFVVETQYQAELITQWTGVPCNVLPTPRPNALLQAFDSFKATQGQLEKERVQIAFLGRPDSEKGIKLFLDACHSLLRPDSSVKIGVVIQIIDEDRHKVNNEAIKQALGDDARVRYVYGGLNAERYGELLASVDCLVMPYRKIDYIGRNSSAALDAFCCGVPVITTEGTWMDDEMHRIGSGLTFIDGDVEDLKDKIERFVANVNHFKTLATERSVKARQAYSWDRLIDLVVGNVN